MKRKIRKWTLNITATILLLAALLLIVILNPVLSYANRTTHKNYTIFHNKPLDQFLIIDLDNATKLLSKSELYDPNFKVDICLNDGSFYNRLIEKIQGQAFGFGFYNKLVLEGKANYKENTVEVNGYKCNLTQLLTHELTHCLQYNALGLLKSNPIGQIPAWKNEGYPEYISRQNEDQTDLFKNISKYIETAKTSNDKWGISFNDSTYTSREYYRYWLLVTYCIKIKKMSYQQILQESKEKFIDNEMMNWYNQQF